MAGSGRGSVAWESGTGSPRKCKPARGRTGSPRKGRAPGAPGGSSGDLWLYPVTENPCVYAAITNTATKSSTETLKPTMKML